MQYPRFAGDSLQVIEKSTSVLAKSLAPDEKAVKIRGRAISVDLKKTQDSRLERMSIEILNGAKMESPGGKSIRTGRKPKIVDIKVFNLWLKSKNRGLYHTLVSD